MKILVLDDNEIPLFEEVLNTYYSTDHGKARQVWGWKDRLKSKEEFDWVGEMPVDVLLGLEK